MKLRAFVIALLVGVAVSPAWATVVVSIEPQDSVVLLGGPFTIDIVAEIPQAEAVSGWGLDLNVLDSAIVETTGSITIGPAWAAAPSMDGDGLAGLGFPDAVWGNVVLATVELMPLSLGATDLTLSDSAPGDLTEGFAFFPSGFAEVDYVGGTVTVVPEPAAILFTVLGGIALLRRRMRCLRE